MRRAYHQELSDAQVHVANVCVSKSDIRQHCTGTRSTHPRLVASSRSILLLLMFVQTSQVSCVVALLYAHLTLVWYPISWITGSLATRNQWRPSCFLIRAQKPWQKEILTRPLEHTTGNDVPTGWVTRPVSLILIFHLPCYLIHFLLVISFTFGLLSHSRLACYLIHFWLVISFTFCLLYNSLFACYLIHFWLVISFTFACYLIHFWLVISFTCRILDKLPKFLPILSSNQYRPVYYTVLWRVCSTRNV
jgi:hypothetical protein